MQKILLCSLYDLKDTSSVGFSLDMSNGPLELFLVRKGDVVYGYLNRCPHTGVNLDWVPDQFLDASACFIQCATHGALFRIEDGVCLRGPCAGERLQAVEISVVSGQVWLLSAQTQIRKPGA